MATKTAPAPKLQADVFDTPPAATVAARRGVPGDVFATLQGIVLGLEPNEAYTLGHIAAGAKAVLSDKGFPVKLHNGLVRSTLLTMAEIDGTVVRDGKRFKLAPKATAPKPAPAAAKPKAKKAAPKAKKALGSTDNAPAKFCRCGCGEQVTRLFRQGHDARHAGNLVRKWEAGELTRSKAIAAAQRISDALGRKVIRGIEIREERAAKKAAAAKAAKPAKTKEATS